MLTKYLFRIRNRCLPQLGEVTYIKEKTDRPMPMKIEYARIGLYPGGGGGVSDDDLKEN